MAERLLGPGQGIVHSARGSVMAFEAIAEQTGGDFSLMAAPAMDAYFAELERLWSGDRPPTVDEERALMSRYGTEPA